MGLIKLLELSWYSEKYAFNKDGAILESFAVAVPKSLFNRLLNATDESMTDKNSAKME